MKISGLFKKNILRISGLVVLVGFPIVVFAQAMQSTTYKIQSDSINIGGIASSSSSYGLEDTVGEVGTGTSSSTNYTNNAGYQEMQSVYLAVSSPSDVTLANISGITGGSSQGSASWLVTTDNTAGYSMQIAASTSPALASSGSSFADYVPATSDPDYTFTLPTNASLFAFSPEGNDVINRFKDNGSACATGSLETASACWDGFSSSPKNIAASTSSNQPNGTITTVQFKASSGTAHLQLAGTYSATITVTAIAL
jgi:hypothetical protein